MPDPSPPGWDAELEAEAVQERIASALDVLDYQHPDYATTSEQWHAALVVAIQHSDRLCAADRALLTRFAGRPWQRKRGGVAKIERDEQMLSMRQFFLREGWLETNIIDELQRRFARSGIGTRDAVVKALRAAEKRHKPEASKKRGNE
jgi:hypothetical protein